jgi:hypothetical protein
VRSISRLIDCDLFNVHFVENKIIKRIAYFIFYKNAILTFGRVLPKLRNGLTEPPNGIP